jgi:hypothetical protein
LIQCLLGQWSFMKCIYLIFVLGLIFPQLACAAEPPPCDASLIPTDGTDGYKLRSGGVCEGLFVSRVGAPTMEIVSVTLVDPLHGDAPSHVGLSVALPSNMSIIPVRAVGIPYGFYYRLDAVAASGKVIDWKAGGILNRIKMPLDQVGVFAFTADDTGAPVYYPVLVATSTPKPEPAQVTVTLRVAGIPEDLKWQFFPKQPDKAPVTPPEGVEMKQGRITVKIQPLAGSLRVCLESVSQRANLRRSMMAEAV